MKILTESSEKWAIKKDTSKQLSPEVEARLDAEPGGGGAPVHGWRGYFQLDNW